MTVFGSYYTILVILSVVVALAYRIREMLVLPQIEIALEEEQKRIH